MLLILVIVVLVLLCGGFGASPYNRYGYGGWSPLGLILAIVVVLYLMGRLHF